MIKFEDRYFIKFDFSKDQIKANLNNAFKDFRIAKEDHILEVKFNYAYTAFIKIGIAILSFHGRKARSVPGHHVKIIEKIAQILDDESINDMGNLMRSKRNLDLYAGGIEVTEKECREYMRFADSVLTRIKKIIISVNNHF